MSVELVATNKSDSLFLNRFPATLGRGADAAQVAAIPGSCHCLVSLAEDQLTVWDLGAAGGTLVNGTRVTKALLRPGDTLELGGMEFHVNYMPSSRRYLFGVRN